MKKSFLILLVFAMSCSSSGTNDQNTDKVDSTKVASEKETPKEGLDRINLPDGFKIEVFAEVENARSLALSPSGVVYVGNREEDKVYALKDEDGDGKADKKYVLAEGLSSPNGVAFKDGDLYIAEISRILKLSDIETQLENPPAYEIVNDLYPTEGHHGWKYIAFGPDGKLYVPVGAPCNICESEDEIFATITRMNPDGTGREIVAKGIRNTVGFDWKPDTKELWFTDNGRDMMGDNFPPGELNRLTKKGQHFGYPYCHGGEIADPEFGEKFPCSDFVPPVWKFEAHTASLGFTFYTGDMFPEEYKGDIIVAQHGSWNRSKKIGYRLMHVSIEGNRATKAEVFADGWLNDQTQTNWGRPVDVIQLKDGSILVSDDFGHNVYRIYY
ncbi:PQQ-dependent sugar dehydrogenase [Fulvivirga sediminis]|uniref:Sorbosone dehydrogenase family protein n=1 Tax=Fulvivirga sediminis TaxID=2803949 RepID=A0A937K252_9BACT|nr:sorbosone dehydrogenase family protein [Fulvivirga sediminis]MBL3657417.1 sorbosone dehydrogenase family protein [Fulvivirga sediminis]